MVSLQIPERASEPPLKSFVLVTEIENFVSNCKKTKKLSKDVKFIDRILKFFLMSALFFQKPQIVEGFFYHFDDFKNKIRSTDNRLKIPLSISTNFHLKKIMLNYNLLEKLNRKI